MNVHNDFFKKEVNRARPQKKQKTKQKKHTTFFFNMLTFYKKYVPSRKTWQAKNNCC